MPEELTKNVGILGGRKTGIAAQREAALKQGAAAPIDIYGLSNRLGLIFDDSGSMESNNAIEDAKEGCEEFFKVCNPNDTAIALYDFGSIKEPLTNDLIQLIKTVRGFGADHGTPLYATLRDLLSQPITRGIVFSDGQPTDKEDIIGQEPNGFSSTKKGTSVIELFVAKKIPIDTVFIGKKGDSGEKVLKDIAERTGGIFLHFQKGASTMKQAFKYLAPKYRAMLSDGSFRRKLEQGEVK